MRKFRLIILYSWLVLLVAYSYFPFGTSSIELLKYQKDFVSLTKPYCAKIETPPRFLIKFGKLSDSEIGVCKVFLFRKEITIDKEYWDKASQGIKKQLVYHELTHCILNIHHVDDFFNYMNPYLNEIPETELLLQVEKNAQDYCNI